MYSRRNSLLLYKNVGNSAGSHTITVSVILNISIKKLQIVYVVMWDMLQKIAIKLGIG